MTIEELVQKIETRLNRTVPVLDVEHFTLASSYEKLVRDLRSLLKTALKETCTHGRGDPNACADCTDALVMNNPIARGEYERRKAIRECAEIARRVWEDGDSADKARVLILQKLDG